jgi:hypothetical protein
MAALLSRQEKQMSNATPEVSLPLPAIGGATTTATTVHRAECSAL